MGREREGGSLDFQNAIFDLKHIFHILYWDGIRAAEDATNCGIHFQHKRAETESSEFLELERTHGKVLQYCHGPSQNVVLPGFLQEKSMVETPGRKTHSYKSKTTKTKQLSGGLLTSVYDLEDIFRCRSLSCPWHKYLEIGTVIVDKKLNWCHIQKIYKNHVNIWCDFDDVLYSKHIRIWWHFIVSNLGL